MDRFQILIARAGAGAFWGACTGGVLIAIAKHYTVPRSQPDELSGIHEAKWVAWSLCSTMAIAALVPFAIYLGGPNGLAVGAPDLVRITSPAPSKDASKGENIIAHVADISVPVGRYPTATIMNDSTAIIHSDDNLLFHVQLSTGDRIGKLPVVLEPLGRYELEVSPDGRLIALRTNDRDHADGGRYPRSRTRLRFFGYPEFDSKGEFWGEPSACDAASTSSSMRFAVDGKTIWIACGQQFGPKSDDIMAIELNVTDQTVVNTRVYGQKFDSGPIAGLKNIGADTWAWQFRDDNPFRIANLTRAADVAAIPVPTSLAGGMTGQYAEMDQTTARLLFCGTPPGVPPQTIDAASSICRVLSFEPVTGVLNGSSDTEDIRLSKSKSWQAGLGGGVQIAYSWSTERNGGLLVVSEEKTGRELQRVESIAQRPIAISKDGTWIITTGIYISGLRIYHRGP